MSIHIKSASELDKMRRAGAIVEKALNLLGEMIAPGVTTDSLDRAAEKLIRAEGAVPSFLGHDSGVGSLYPKSVCISINDEVIHGIPGKRKLAEGDVVSVDIGAYKDGFHGDAARTFACGAVSERSRKLIEVTRQAFFEGAKAARVGGRVGDIGAAVQDYVEAQGFSVVRDYIGHGVGRMLHEAPEVPNYRPKLRGAVLRAGMTLAIEPMVNAGGRHIRVLPDGWTVVTGDGSASAHYENTILITESGPELFTQSDGAADLVGGARFG